MYGTACDDWSGPCGGVEGTGRSRCSPPGCEAGVWRPSISQDDAEHDLECRKPKAVGEPYEGKPHVRFEVAGGGNQDLGPRRHSLTLPAEAAKRVSYRPIVYSAAPLMRGVRQTNDRGAPACE
jgi:hypothetical protein